MTRTNSFSQFDSLFGTVSSRQHVNNGHGDMAGVTNFKRHNISIALLCFEVPFKRGGANYDPIGANWADSMLICTFR